MTKARKSEGMAAAIAIRDCHPATWAQDVAAMAYWRAFGRRDSDVFLCSYPKSGRTWLRFMIIYYQLRLFDVEYDLTLKNTFLLSPNVTLFSPVRLRALPVGAPIHRVLGTHSDYPRLFRGQRFIFLHRDLRDVLVSYYRQRVALGEFRGDMAGFIRSRWGLSHAIRYHNRWARALSWLPQDTFLKLSYERLHAETEACLRACLEFLGVEIQDALIAETVAHASAENMRRIEAKWGRADFSAEQLRHDETGFRVRKAIVGAHKDELPADLVAHIESTLRSALVDDCGYNY